MDIKKVDDKPMVIHTKQKTKIHRAEPKHFSIKNGKVTRITGKDVIPKQRMQLSLQKKVNVSAKPLPKVKGSLYNAGMAGAGMASHQLEGGEEVRQSAALLSTAARPVTGTASKGADLFRKKAMSERQRRIKTVGVGKRLARAKAGKNAKKVSKAVTKKNAKKAAGATTQKIGGTDIHARKLSFFLDKLKAKEEQTDSFAKLAKDVIVRQATLVARHIAGALMPYLLVGLLVVVMIAVPVVTVVGTIYNSPFAIFMPALEEGETIQDVASAYLAAFNSEAAALADAHDSCDAGEIVYVDYEGYEATPSNYYDILAVYMVRYGIGDTATIVNDTTRAWMQGVVDDMCSYTTSVRTDTEEIENEDGETKEVETTTLCVNITLLTWRDMISVYDFNEEEQELLAEFMSSEYLAALGYSAGSGGNMQSTLSAQEITEIMSGITDSTRKTVVSFALSKVGYPYSQTDRDSGRAYDCSSLAYYAWKSAGVDISYEGMTTASAEGNGLYNAGKTISFSSMQPGDLIFYSTATNGRFLNITHVAVYVGNGKVVEALNETYGVVYQDVRTSNIVLICSPD